MTGARFIIGDSLTVLRTMPDASVDLVLTSPPFLGLRSYLPSDHKDKTLEMGSEPTPGEFIDALLDIVEECRRVLAPHGSMCVELGDTYAGNDTRDGSLAPDAKFPQRPGVRTALAKSGGAWPVDKSLCLIPESFRWALVYGHNPFNGRPTPRWRARNVIRWCRPNPPVGALGDKVRPATSDMVVACVGRSRYFDLDAVRTPTDRDDKGGLRRGTPHGTDERRVIAGESAQMTGSNPAGAPPLDHWWDDDDRFDQDAWNIPTQPYKGSHYATFPERLVVRPILSMCPERVCTVCGKPSERITEKTPEYAAARAAVVSRATGTRTAGNDALGKRVATGGGAAGLISNGVVDTAPATVGWSDFGHDAWRPGIVLDPFAGSGTTLAVAVGHGRDAIGIDLDERNADLARERCGMFLTVEHHATRGADKIRSPLLDGPEAA